ncbi:Leucine-responsive regulatory protein [Sulfitobacter sp. DSM 110093]|uniref:Lrp/AsnC family transcriptional regulator n=1 Tax=Sulfitobacter sp. DSM 110093 TaxID=2883127 RepID=UPI001FADAA09|nr:Lrp/AsnC family transcriptional regulator [Sulfitobacter sp. DSM 110093]UOA33302.1 Leucine-responsive regulatory protein [Sulfitobacter sp. DSM 110093]
MLVISTNLDSYDLNILHALQRNGRATINELAETVGLSPSPVARRLRNLEAAGVITGYAALIDEAVLGYEFSVFVSVKLERQVDNALASFETAVRRFPEVVDCWLMTGNRDYLLRVATRGPADFERFLTSAFTKVPGVASIESSIPLRRVKAGLSRTLAG